jgi:HSP20 family protein
MILPQVSRKRYARCWHACTLVDDLEEAQKMGTIQQRFEVERPIAAVYEALTHPQHILQVMPGVVGVHRVADDIYRVILGPVDANREFDVELTAKTELQRVEWRTLDGGWVGAIQLESTGPTRTAVSVHAESIAGQPETLQPTTAHDALQAFKRALQSARVHVRTPSYSGERASTGEARRYASEWRATRRPALMRPLEYPFTLMRSISRQMDRVWHQVWRGTPIERLPEMVPGLQWNPDVEVCELEDQVRVCVDVPGVDEAHLHVEVDDRGLTIRGERQDYTGPYAGAHRRSELHYGSFSRRIPLPEGVDAEHARALLRNGVLEVRIPLSRRRARRVPVEHVPE